MLCKKTAFRMYVCENGIRVPRDRVCDGTKHCPDGSDEKYCNKPMMPIVKGIFGSDGTADDQSGQATDQPKVSASFPLVEFHGAPDSSSNGSPEKTVEVSVTTAPAAQADESQTTTTAAVAETTAAPQTTVAEETPAATEEPTEASAEAATEAAAAEEGAAQPTETEATTESDAAAATEAEATTAETATQAAETEEPSTVATVAHHAKMKKYPFVNPWAKTPLPPGLTLPPAALNGTTSSAASTTTTSPTVASVATTTRCPHSYTVAIQASGYGSSVAACPTEEPASAGSDDIPEYVGQSGRKQFIPAYTSTDATPPPTTPALEASVDEALMKILSAKYGGNSK
ncbi:hypothetical protein AAVH_22272 [Aphelenchoides avenae]|nr:hypothetical protein AAVH_22272 [Aphelenchus avenae]